ncbi:MAG: phosphoglucosamine mutase [Clostridiales bacterium]|jgi:phosphoglucosamine mutase|nr:phosphoglucosamine mutase [Clostridiales bacterium]
MGKFFGTDGVRGLANEYLTPELAFLLGKAGATALTEKGLHSPKIVVGSDTRLSSGMLEAALSAGMCSVGANVCVAGVIPTPGVAWLVKNKGFDAGVMISASHNPFYDNGIKFFNADGYKLPDDIELEIERLIEMKADHFPRPINAEVGSISALDDALGDYAEFLTGVVDGLDLGGLKIGVDCANGAVCRVAPGVFASVGADARILNFKPDGKNINDGCGSTHMDALAEYVTENGLDMGIAFDGDGDRCLMVDSEGDIIDGDQIISICADHMTQKGELPKNGVVITVMSNLGLRVMARERGITLEQTDVGDRYVLERMLSGGYALGGEQSGHVIFLNHTTTGDGMLTALKTLSILKEKNVTLKRAASIMTVFPQILVNVRAPNAKKMEYSKSPVIIKAIEEVENDFKDIGRALIRPSGTEPIIRIMLEGPDVRFLKERAGRLARVIEEALRD